MIVKSTTQMLTGIGCKTYECYNFYRAFACLRFKLCESVVL